MHYKIQTIGKIHLSVFHVSFKYPKIQFLRSVHLIQMASRKCEKCNNEVFCFCDYLAGLKKKIMHAQVCSPVKAPVYLA